MSSYGQLLSARCASPCEVTCGQPYVDACSEPCVSSCGDSRAIVYAPPVVVTFPGPIISSCPTESIVGTSIPEIHGGMGSGGGFGRNYYPYFSRGYYRYRYGNYGPF
ncbi:feather keratin B-4-like [Aphelocoma coerulescens]|uniref:feather keratin B-4-like n=1 Tax=Aphelocoma coerulescens TaxID=39617 RepID=UPI00360535D7